MIAALVAACSSGPSGAGPDVLGRSSVIGQVFALETTATVVGAAVCLRDNPSLCATTDVDGNFELNDLPDDAKLLISIDAAGLVPGLRMVRTGDGTQVALGPTGMPSTNAISGHQETLMIGHSMGTGYVAFLVVDADALPVTNIRSYLTPTAGDGPYYFNGLREIDADLTIGTDASGYYYNLPPANYAISATTLDGLPTAVCEAEIDGLGWGRDVDGAGLVVPVLADTMTFVVPVCAEIVATP